MTELLNYDSIRHLTAHPSPSQRAFRALSSVNLNSLWVLLRNGPSAALDFISHSYHLYSGFGMPHLWQKLPWRDDLRIPVQGIEYLFPEIDFSRSPELYFPFPRNLGVLPQELVVLGKVVSHLSARRVIEFGTAEGRTALNIAAQLPAEGEIITLDLPPIPGKNEVGFFYWDQPVQSKIKQVFASVDAWDSRPYRASADVVFCDACDLMPGLAAEAYQAFSIVRPGGVIFRHDYSTAKGPTRFWEWLARELPVYHIDGTFLLCLRLDSDEVYKKTQDFLLHPVLKDAMRIPSV
jgi:hypothetical protein